MATILALEILAMLPRHPFCVPLYAIAAALDLPTQFPISRAIGELKERGIIIETYIEDGRRVIAIQPASWAMAVAMAEKYWTETYG